MRSTRTRFPICLILAGLCAGCTSDQREGSGTGRIQYLNPEGLHKNPAYSQVAVASGNTKTVYVGGQNSVDAKGGLVGKGDLRAQTERSLENVQAALAAAGASPEHVVKLNVYVLQGQSLQAGLEAFQQTWGTQPSPPTISVLFVAGLAHPDFLSRSTRSQLCPRIDDRRFDASVSEAPALNMFDSVKQSITGRREET